VRRHREGDLGSQSVTAFAEQVAGEVAARA